MRATCPIAWPVIWLHLNNSRDLQQTARSTQHLRLGTRMQPCVRAEPTVTRLGESRQQPEMNKETQTRWDGLSTSHPCMMLAAAQCYIENVACMPARVASHMQGQFYCSTPPFASNYRLTDLLCNGVPSMCVGIDARRRLNQCCQ